MVNTIYSNLMIITFLERKKTPMYESKKCRLGIGGDTKGHDLKKNRK